MIRALNIASSGMQAQQFNLDVIANNLANVNTTGFKKSRVDFQSLLYQNIRRPTITSQGVSNPVGVEVGNGVRIVGTVTNFDQGLVQESESAQDIAIEGKGFLMVQLPDGRVGYTRGGACRLDSEGFLVNADGYLILSSKGNMPLTESITLDGKTMLCIKPDTDSSTVSFDLNGVVTTEKFAEGIVPELELANFANPAGLEAIGSTTYIAGEVCGKLSIGQPASAGFGIVRAGFLEGSNVKVVDEMVKMIMAQRAYEISSKSIQTADEMMGLTNNLRR